MYRMCVLYLCAIVLAWVESFPLDEDVVCENNNYFGNLQAYNSDELELLEDACPVPRGFNRREIPVRFRKPISEYEKNADESDESNNSMDPKNTVSKYSQDSFQSEEKFCQRPKTHHKFNSFHQKLKRKYSKYDSDCRKLAGAKSYRIPPFETFYKSYSQYGGPGMKELNTEDIDEIVDVKKQPHSMELIREEIIDKPTDVQEINVERVVQETDEKSAGNNEEKLKQDDEDNYEASGEEEQDETEEAQDETEEKDKKANNGENMLNKQKINEDTSTTENTQLKQDRTTINV